jgi:hypothetical protein
VNLDQYASDLLAHLLACEQAPTHDSACNFELQLQPLPQALPTPVSAVPEPAPLALLLAGLVCIGLVKWRRGTNPPLNSSATAARLPCMIQRDEQGRAISLA